MTAVRFVTLWCDADCEAETAWEPTARAARLVAKKQGWTRRGGKDYCPEHRDAAPAQAEEGSRDMLLPNLAGDRIRQRVTFGA